MGLLIALLTFAWYKPIPLKYTKQTKLAVLNLSDFNYSLTHNPRKNSPQNNSRITAQWPHAVFKMSNNRGSSAPFYSITLAATNNRTNTKESCFIKSITGKNSQSKLIYHHSSHILQEPNKWFPSYRNQKDVCGCRGKGDEEDQTVFPGGAKWNKLLGNKYSSLLR